MTTTKLFTKHGRTVVPSLKRSSQTIHSMIPRSSSIALFIGAVFFLLNGGLFAHHVFSSLEPHHIKPYSSPNLFFSFTQGPVTFSTSPQPVSIPDLLGHSQDYHQQLVSIRGLITQPELHLDITELYFNFVFRLEQGTDSIIVYGRHDRTLGSPVIRMHQSVEVVGTFFREQERSGSTIFNVLKAISVRPYPSSIPEST